MDLIGFITACFFVYFSQRCLILDFIVANHQESVYVIIGAYSFFCTKKVLKTPTSAF